MSHTATDPLVADLTRMRREMRRELARVRWWRRLAQARRELAVAQLTRPDPLGATGMDVTLEALAADAPTSQELASAIWPHDATASASSMEELASLDSRLESYELRVSETLNTVTNQMVKAMGNTHRAGLRADSNIRTTGVGNA